MEVSAPARKRVRRHKTDAFLSKGDFSPKAIFEAFKGPKPPQVLQYIERDGLRVCKHCFAWKPRDRFRRLQGAIAWSCLDCVGKVWATWRAANPDKVRTHQLKLNENRRKRMAFSMHVLGRGMKRTVSPEELDVLRRALVERPPELEGEGDKLAYFRGFVAGAKRTKDEDTRFDRLKDLCHRIASEKGVYGDIYEERVAVGYEGLLAFMRKRPQGGGWYKDDKHERACAAVAIRNSIVDYMRAHGPLKAGGAQRYETDTVGSHANEDGDASFLEPPAQADHTGESNDLWIELQDLLLEAVRKKHVSYHLPEIAHMRIRGLLFKEIGESLGMTESNVSRIWTESQPWLIKNARKLLGDSPGLEALEASVA